MKKTLAILLSLALVICMIPATAFANTPTATPEYDLSKATITLSYDSYTYDGTEKKPDVKVMDGTNELTKDTHYTVTYSSNTVAGTAMVTVKGKVDPPSEGETASQYYGTVTKSFTINKLDLATANFENADITSNDINETSTGLNDSGLQKIKLKVAGAEWEKIKNVVTITSQYTAAKATTPASVTVIVAPVQGNNNVVNSREINFTVKTDISSGFDVRLVGNPKFTYNGAAQIPSSSYVQVFSGSTVLNPSTDYTITYSNNVNGGTSANAVIEGRGNYTGTFSKNALFYIDPKNIANTSIEVSTALSGGTPTVTIKDGNALLKLGTDYSVQTMGANSVQISGMNNYTGNVNRTFTIADRYLSSITNNGGTQYYNGAVQHANISVIGSDGSILTMGRDYSIKYTYTDPITKKTSYTESPKDSGAYSFTVIGKGRYAGELTGIFSISALPLDWAEIVLGSSTVLYNGVYVPKVTVKHINGNYYFPERDYTVSYRNVGTGYYYSKPTVVVKAVPGGNLSGTMIGSTKTELTKEFSLASRSLSNCTVSFTDSKTSKNYDGNSNFKPPVTVRDYSLNRTLTENLDYKITYKDAAGKVVYALKDAGTYTIIVEGTGAYTGTKTLTFVINGTDISSYTVTLKESSVNATGYNQTPTILSVKRGYYTLSSGDYTVSYQDESGAEVKLMKAPGTYKVVATGKNGYSGSTYATFTIIGKAQSITGVASSYKAYPGGEVIQLYPKATEGRFTYTSSDSTVATVSASGLVTPLKAGRAKITIATTGTTTYDPATYSTVIKVYPKKAVMTKKPWNYGKKGQVKVRWYKQDNVTRYEIRYSRVKNFAKGTYITKKVNAAQNDYTTQSTTLKNLKSGQRYYVKVRAVKEVYNDYGKKLTYYGAWSGWKSVVVK